MNSKRNDAFNTLAELKTTFIEEEWESYYPCKVCVHPAGHRCGYVGVSKKHPLYRESYFMENSFLNVCEKLITRDLGEKWYGPILDVHGGLTFSCSSENALYLRDPAGLWWFGYDCAHAGDAPDPLYAPKERTRMHYSTATVKTLDFCKKECEKLAEQLRYLETFYYENIDRFLEEGLK